MGSTSFFFICKLKEDHLNVKVSSTIVDRIFLEACGPIFSLTMILLPFGAFQRGPGEVEGLEMSHTWKVAEGWLVGQRLNGHLFQTTSWEDRN